MAETRDAPQDWSEIIAAAEDDVRRTAERFGVPAWWIELVLAKIRADYRSTEDTWRQSHEPE